MFTKDAGRQINKDANFEAELAAAEEALISAYKNSKQIIPGSSWIYINGGYDIERMRAALIARGFTIDPKPVSYALKVYL